MTGRIEKTVFISYRRINFPWAQSIYLDLINHDYDVFLDYKSIPSGDFEQAIIENIKSRAHFIIVLTPSAVERCNEPDDWLRREIEIAIDSKRNIIPLRLESFDFGSPATIKALTGKLSTLKRYQAPTVSAEYFDEAMERLRSDKYLNRPLESVLHPVSDTAKQVIEKQKVAASEVSSISKERLVAQEWYEKGYVFQEDGNLDEAIRCYSQATEIRKDFAEAYNNRGVLYRAKGDLDKAIIDFNLALQFKPNSAEIYSNRGITYGDQKILDKAIADFDTALVINPNFHVAYSNRGLARRINGDFDGAIADLDKALLLKPDDADSYYNRGNVFRYKGNREEAIKDFTRAIRFRRKFPDAYLNRGNLRSEKGDLKRAIADFDKAIILRPNNAGTYFNRASAHRAKKDFESAISDYTRFIQLELNDARGYHDRGITFSMLGDIVSALFDFRKAVELKPDSGSIRSSLIKVLKLLGHSAEAKQQEQITRKLIHNENEYNQACFEAICGNTDKALKLLKIGLEKRQATKEWAQQDPDLENIRNDPRFKRLVGE